VTAGRATLVLAVGLLLAALTFGTTSLYVPGAGLFIAYTGARLWVWLAARRAQLDQQPGPRTVVEDDAYEIDVEVRAGLPIPGGTITHPLAEVPVHLGWTTSARVGLGLSSLRRGWREVAPVRLRIEDPLRLAAAEVQAPGSRRVLVLPRIEPVLLPEGALEGGDAYARLGAGTPRGDGLGKRTVASEMDGLRSYRPGSPASRIHWPILARSGELVERRLVGGADASPIVALDAERPSDPDALDRAVRAAASLCHHLARSGGCILLLPGDQVPHPIDSGLRLWPRAHARLAVVRAEGRPPEHRLASRDAALFWVSASADASRMTNGLARHARYLVTTSPLGAAEPVFTVAGCSGYRTGVASPRVSAPGRAA
jgi:uncharacterized protein (DUF58 family)